MSGETEQQPSGWTIDSLHSHLLRVIADRDKHFEEMLRERDLRYQQRYDASSKALEAALLAAEKAVDTALEAAEKAVIKAEFAADKRFEAVNEFRGQLSDQAARFVSRSEFDLALGNLKDAVAALKTMADLSVGAARHGRNQLTVVAVSAAVLGVLVSVLALFLTR